MRNIIIKSDEFQWNSVIHFALYYNLYKYYDFKWSRIHPKEILSIVFKEIKNKIKEGKVWFNLISMWDTNTQRYLKVFPLELSDENFIER